MNKSERIAGAAARKKLPLLLIFLTMLLCNLAYYMLTKHMNLPLLAATAATIVILSLTCYLIFQYFSWKKQSFLVKIKNCEVVNESEVAEVLTIFGEGVQ
jgi:hypothetical protein